MERLRVSYIASKKASDLLEEGSNLVFDMWSMSLAALWGILQEVGPKSLEWRRQLGVEVYIEPQVASQAKIILHGS